MSRVREESLRRGTRQGVPRGLVATGRVITSAEGVVRSLLVPALVRDIGPTAWWPGKPSRIR